MMDYDAWIYVLAIFYALQLSKQGVLTLIRHISSGRDDSMWCFSRYPFYVNVLKEKTYPYERFSYGAEMSKTT